MKVPGHPWSMIASMTHSGWTSLGRD
jgi:hypothetical protein